jgi:hypothetical protein
MRDTRRCRHTSIMIDDWNSKFKTLADEKQRAFLSKNIPNFLSTHRGKLEALMRHRTNFGVLIHQISERFNFR